MPWQKRAETWEEYRRLYRRWRMGFEHFEPQKPPREKRSPHPPILAPEDQAPADVDTSTSSVQAVAALVAAEQAWDNLEGGNLAPEDSDAPEPGEPAADGQDAQDGGEVEPAEPRQDGQEAAEAPQDGDSVPDTDEGTVMTREAAMGMTIAQLKAYAAEHDLPEPKGQKAVIVDALVEAGLVVEPLDGAQDEE